MQWRALVMLWTGLALIYLVSLLQETPYPHPAKLFIPPSPPSSSTAHGRQHLHPPDTTVLILSNTHVYQTSIWYELSPPEHTLRLGSGPFKVGGLGYLHQQRQELSIYFTNSSDPATTTVPSPPWETTQDHVLNGPISHVSSLGHGYDDDDIDNNFMAAGLQFGVLYHVLDDDRIQHWVRVFYFATTMEGSGDGDHSIQAGGLEFKDILLPGNTWISTFSLESDAILYSRDPDYYRFRWVSLPNDLTTGPHSEKANPIILTKSDPGDSTHLFNQPDDIEEYRGLLSGMYSPIPGSKQVFTMNAYKTFSNFYVKGIIAENGTNEWFGKKILDYDYDVFSQESMEYMAIVDGVPIQQERIQLDMPKLCIGRSKNAKVVVMSSIKYPLVSLAYMDDASDLVLQQKDVNAMVHHGGNIWIKEYVGMDDMDGELLGLQLDAAGHSLAAWTDKNQLFLFTRQLTNQQPQHQHFQSFAEDEKRDISLDEGRLERWFLSMVITKDQGALVDSIDAVAFVTTNSSNYILVGLKNGGVQSYTLDQTEIQKPINFWSFLIDQWNIWLPMSIVVFLFVVSENQQASRLEQASS